MLVTTFMTGFLHAGSQIKLPFRYKSGEIKSPVVSIKLIINFPDISQVQDEDSGTSLQLLDYATFSMLPLARTGPF